MREARAGAVLRTWGVEGAVGIPGGFDGFRSAFGSWGRSWGWV